MNQLFSNIERDLGLDRLWSEERGEFVMTAEQRIQWAQLAAQFRKLADTMDAIVALPPSKE
jgi:hypothetical protein